MILLSDKGQKEGQHTTKERWWKENGIEVLKVPLPVGDYVLVNDKVQDVLDRKAARKMDVKKMDFLGSYSVAVDTKKNIQELIMDICGKQHGRFRDEAILAQNNGIKLYVLVENEQIMINRSRNIFSPYIGSLDKLSKFVNPRLFMWQSGKQKYPNATRGVTLMKACITMQEKYGCEFVFCHELEAGRKVIELLTKGPAADMLSPRR